jgi:hypothetical protein
MIDTDKYEGHAKEGWYFDSAHVLRDGYGKEITELVGEDWLDDKATQALIADAPDLLAEVKQLRERLIRAYDWAENAVNGNDSAMMDYTEYVCGGEEE